MSDIGSERGRGADAAPQPTDPSRRLDRRRQRGEGATSATPRDPGLRIAPITEWENRLPWLWAGTTQRGWGTDGTVTGAMQALLGTPTGRSRTWRAVVRCRQVHGAVVRVREQLPPGIHAASRGDGHVTRTGGLLLAVTLADCVPIFLADPVRRAVGLLHAGWRGTAAGIVQRGLAAMRRECGSVPKDLLAHLGPAICGRCYEVGPEVFSALGLPPPARPAPIDLREAIRERLVTAGLRPDRITTSRECTLCGDGRYFSHRRGDAGRHLGFIGIRGSQRPAAARPARQPAGPEAPPTTASDPRSPTR